MQDGKKALIVIAVMAALIIIPIVLAKPKLGGGITQTQFRRINNVW